MTRSLPPPVVRRLLPARRSLSRGMAAPRLTSYRRYSVQNWARSKFHPAGRQWRNAIVVVSTVDPPAFLDHEISFHFAESENRPQQLFLTGEQISANDVNKHRLFPGPSLAVALVA